MWIFITVNSLSLKPTAKDLARHCCHASIGADFLSLTTRKAVTFTRTRYSKPYLDVGLQGHWPHTGLEIEQPLHMRSSL